MLSNTGTIIAQTSVSTLHNESSDVVSSHFTVSPISVDNTGAGYVTATSLSSSYGINVAATTSQSGSLATGYAEVIGALKQLRNEASLWTINDDVFRASAQVAAALAERHIPRPQIFSHGPESVVFNWQGANNFYLTIEADTISALVSSNAGIRLRRKLPRPNTQSSQNFFFALQNSNLLAPPSK